MSLRLEMLQVSRLAPAVLGEDASAQIARFAHSKLDPCGGFWDRDGQPDLYYTSFGVDILTALQRDLPEALPGFLAAQDPAALDFVHLCCLIRLMSAVPAPKPGGDLFARLEGYRSGDGGYNQASGAASGSAYACLLAYGAYADHGREPPDNAGIAACLGGLAQPNGGWANDRDFPITNAPATAAAVTLSRNLMLPVPPETPGFLQSCFHGTSGGFVPFPGAPLPDLLSTAVALHALDGLQADIAPMKERCLDFIDTLWSADGGFHGNWDDDTLDLEYTFYGLLALGHLSL